MSTDSYWRATAPLPRLARLEEDISGDVIVVGGGIAGLTAAFLLKQLGNSVILLERRRCAEGDTGSTSAHLTCVTDVRMSDLISRIGRDHAAAVWDAGLAAIAFIEETARAEGIACDFQRVPGFLHAPLKSGDRPWEKEFREEADLGSSLGFDASFVQHVPLFDRPGMLLPGQGIFHPVKYLRGLINAIDGRGSHVFEHSEVTEFTEKPLGVKVNGHTVRGRHMIFATHVPLMGNNGILSATLFQSKLSSYSSYVIGGAIDKGAVPVACFWDTSNPYYYLRIDPERNYVIFGGEDHKTGQDDHTSARYVRLEAHLRSFVPSVQVEHRWSGQVIETNDGLPFIGELGERQFVATGFAGNGLTFGTLAGMMACDHIAGRKNPWSGLFDVHRKGILGGAWDYLKENIDYPYYLLKDRLLGAENAGIETVGKGEGRILVIDGKRMAVSRNQHGKLIVRSATCTHMGCLVRWNEAEGTWDCPCHGSRFTPDGDVLAGPAETPLHVRSAAKS